MSIFQISDSSLVFKVASDRSTVGHNPSTDTHFPLNPYFLLHLATCQLMIPSYPHYPSQASNMNDTFLEKSFVRITQGHLILGPGH